MIAKARSQFLEYLKQQGLKWTSEREKIVQEAFALEGHFEADDLVYRLRKKGSRTSKASVYRTLPLLVKAGLIKEVIYGERGQHYEHIHDQKEHDHLICLKCGKIVEFEDNSLRKIERKICEEHGFLPQKVLVEIFGYCKKCQQSFSSNVGGIW